VALLRAETTIEVCSYMQLKAFFCQHEHVFYLISLTGIQNEGPFPPSREYIPSVRSAGFAPAIQLPNSLRAVSLGLCRNKLPLPDSWITEKKSLFDCLALRGAMGFI